jgi:hypothetical protein
VRVEGRMVEAPEIRGMAADEMTRQTATVGDCVIGLFARSLGSDRETGRRLWPMARLTKSQKSGG